MKKPIYLDYSSTTPVEEKVVQKMNEYMTIKGNFGNASSRSHSFGWQAEEAVDIARNKIAELINCNSNEIIFTSGATESNNLALKGTANFYKEKGNHIITSQIEHKSVLDTCRQLESEGFTVTYVKPNKYGLIDPKKIEKKINKKTIIISIMHVNNEIGTIQNIQEISSICKKKNIIFHVDAAQSIGKIKIDTKKIKINLMSLSAHKVYGPKGIGSLYICKDPKIRIKPQQHGGGHENGIRSGTLPVHQIVGMGEAYRLAKKKIETENKKIKYLKNKLWKGIKNIEEIYLNGDFKNTIPHILNVSFNFVEGESLIMSLKDLAVSSGSACTSATLEPSYVLKSIGVNDELAHSSIRFSIGRFTTEDEINYTIKLIHDSVKKLRNISPLWEMYKEGIDINKIKWKKK